MITLTFKNKKELRDFLSGSERNYPGTWAHWTTREENRLIRLWNDKHLRLIDICELVPNRSAYAVKCRIHLLQQQKKIKGRGR